MWKVWDKKSNINGAAAEAFLMRNTHLAGEDIIFIKIVDDRITQVEGKNILSKNYSIDISLDNDAFISRYQEVLEDLKNSIEVSDYNPYSDFMC